MATPKPEQKTDPVVLAAATGLAKDMTKVHKNLNTLVSASRSEVDKLIRTAEALPIPFADRAAIIGRLEQSKASWTNGIQSFIDAHDEIYRRLGMNPPADG